MSDRRTWQDHARNAVNASLSTDVYAMQWAHDIRCMRADRAHPRVGMDTLANLEWLEAGYVVRINYPRL